MLPPIAFCFTPDAPPELVAQFNTDFYGGGGERFQVGSPWPNGGFQGVDLTYSFPPDGLFLPAQGSPDMSGPNVLNAALTAQFGDEATWKDLFRQVFDRWEEITGNTYTEVSDDGASWPNSSGNSNRGDIRIVMGGIDGGGAGILAYNFFPSNGDMKLDSAHNFSTGGTERYFRNLIAHEHGHGLGLAHSCPQNSTKLMEPSINASFDGPQIDDIRGAQVLYGDRFEPNTGVSGAPNINGLVVANQASFIEPLTLHNSGDTDTFAVTLEEGERLTIVARPLGGSYASAPQVGINCGTPEVDMAQEELDLRLELLTSGGSPGEEASENGIGLEETIMAAEPGPGSYRIRVTSEGGSGVVQLYELEILLENDGLLGELNGDGCIGSGDLSILIGSWGASGVLADLDDDGTVGSFDLAILLGNWGAGCGG